MTAKHVKGVMDALNVLHAARRLPHIRPIRGNPENATASFQGFRPETLRSQVTKTA
jgi:hypothetical protein